MAFCSDPEKDWRILILGFMTLLFLVLVTHVGLYYYWLSYYDFSQSKEEMAVEDLQMLVSPFSAEELNQLITDFRARGVEFGFLQVEVGEEMGIFTKKEEE